MIRDHAASPSSSGKILGKSSTNFCRSFGAKPILLLRFPSPYSSHARLLLLRRKVNRFEFGRSGTSPFMVMAGVDLPGIIHSLGQMSLFRACECSLAALSLAIVE